MKEFTIVNLTPHPLNLKRVDGTMLTIPPSGTVARVAEKRTDLGVLAGLAVTRAEYGAVEGLPEPVPGKIFVVSALVLAAVQQRADVFAPGPAIRDADGKIVGADGLSATPAYTPADEGERIVGVGADGEPICSNPPGADKIDDIPF
jgi:hypothetical protein